MGSRSRFIIQVFGSLACFWWLLQMVSPGELLNILKGSSYFSVALVAILMIPAVLSRAWRWHYLLKRRGVRVPLVSITKVTFIGMALNLFLPASAGDVVRSYYSWQFYGHKEEMLASSLADKAVALISLFLLGALGGMVCGEKKLALIAIILLLPAGFILFVPMRRLWKIMAIVVKKVFKKELDIDLMLQSFHMDKITFFWALIISIIGWIITNFMYFIAIRAVSGDVGMGFTFAIAPLINIVRMLPITISGLGSSDALMVQLLGVIGIDKHITIAASMIINLTLIVIPGFIGSIFMLNNLRSFKSINAINGVVSKIDV